MQNGTPKALFAALGVVAVFGVPLHAAAAAKLKAIVSIPPQAYFVERIGGEFVDVDILVRPGQSPHTYAPTAKQMVRLGQAKVYFTIGVQFENALLPRVKRMFKELRIVDTRRGVPLREMGCAGHDDHADHDHQHAEDDSSADPHIWLSPKLVKIQAKNVCDALAELDPANTKTFRSNLTAFHAELDAVSEELAQTLAPLKGSRVFVFHPAFGYFLDEFGLQQAPVEVEGKEPTARQLVHLIDEAKAQGVKVIFVQPQFSKKSANVIAKAIGGAVVPIDPLAQNYIANLREMAQKIKTGLGKP